MTNQKGFTLSEFVVGVAIMAIAALATSGALTYILKTKVQLSAKLEQSIDQVLAERVIFKDLSEASPSYNNILVVDDAGQKFFDYYPDIPVRFLTTPPTRTLTLQAQGNISNFYFLSQDNEAGPTMLYDPVAAYTIGPAPTDFNLAATVTFQSLNHQSFITSPSIGNRPNFWNEATVLMLDTPAQLRHQHQLTIINKNTTNNSNTYTI
jgi:prepilin-type N-terminal cleavage/methylation domain-containing protein